MSKLEKENLTTTGKYELVSSTVEVLPEEFIEGKFRCPVCKATKNRFGKDMDYLGVMGHINCAHKRIKPKTSLTSRSKKSSDNSINAVNYIPTSSPQYVEVNDELNLIRSHLESGIPLIIYGPCGSGKSLCLTEFAKKTKTPIIHFDCHEEVTREDLVGNFGSKVENEKQGVLSLAYSIANNSKFERCIIVFEQIDLLTKEMQCILSQYLDWRGHIQVPEMEHVDKLKSGSKLLVTATLDTEDGKCKLISSLKSKFAELKFDNIPENKELKILMNGEIKLKEDLATKVIQLAKKTRTSKFSYTITTADLSMFGRTYNQYRTVYEDVVALAKALINVFLNRFDSNDKERKLIQEEIRTIFGVKI